MLLAVHISDGFFAAEWCLAGFVIAGILAWLGSLRLDDDDIPRIALLTAAVFISSTIHVRLGITSVHLLFNGLVGVLLGMRAALAIGVGLFLQALLLNHGGFFTLGINACVQTIPALAAWGLFHGLRQMPCLEQRWFRATLMAAASVVWVLSVVFSVALLLGDVASARDAVLHPLTGVLALLVAGGAVVAERRLAQGPEFSLGFLIGEWTVLATSGLNCALLLWAGETNWARTPPLLLLLAHLPIALVEGVIVGITVGYLARVKPEILARPYRETAERTANTLV